MVDTACGGLCQVFLVKFSSEEAGIFLWTGTWRENLSFKNELHDARGSQSLAQGHSACEFEVRIIIQYFSNLFDYNCPPESFFICNISWD